MSANDPKRTLWRLSVVTPGVALLRRACRPDLRCADDGRTEGARLHPAAGKTRSHRRERVFAGSARAP